MAITRENYNVLDIWVLAETEPSVWRNEQALYQQIYNMPLTILPNQRSKEHEEEIRLQTQQQKRNQKRFYGFNLGRGGSVPRWSYALGYL